MRVLYSPGQDQKAPGGKAYFKAISMRIYEEREEFQRKERGWISTQLRPMLMFPCQARTTDSGLALAFFIFLFFFFQNILYSMCLRIRVRAWVRYVFMVPCSLPVPFSFCVLFFIGYVGFQVFFDLELVRYPLLLLLKKDKQSHYFFEANKSSAFPDTT